MLKEEFEKRTGQPISDEDYRIIDTVYQYHPAISEASGKDEVAELYKSFVMAIFYDMLPRAEKNCRLKKKLRQTQTEVKQIMEEMAELHEMAAEKESSTGIRQITITIDAIGIKDIPLLCKAIDELKDAHNRFDPTVSEGKMASGDPKRHSIKEMVELMDKTLTGYLRDPHVSVACKKRVRHCIERRIDEIYKNSTAGS